MTPDRVKIVTLMQEVERLGRKNLWLSGELDKRLLFPPRHPGFDRRLDEMTAMLRRWAGGKEQGLVYLAVRLALWRRWQRFLAWWRQ